LSEASLVKFRELEPESRERLLAARWLSWQLPPPAQKRCHLRASRPRQNSMPGYSSAFSATRFVLFGWSLGGHKSKRTRNRLSKKALSY
jgi:hypothetical protein